jgi:hypothetical protein
MAETNTPTGFVPDNPFVKDQINTDVPQETEPVTNELQAAKDEISLLRQQLAQRDEKIQQLLKIRPL